jgi:hypothetical protein
MSETFVVAVEGLDALSNFGDLTAKIIKAARLAVNKTTNDVRIEASRQIYRQVKFPSGYLAPSTGRLYIKKLASQGDLEGIVSGRTRPTSLSRFVTGSLAIGKGGRKEGLTVEVKRGAVKFMPGAFLVRLRSGLTTENSNNMGVAVRVKNGKPPPGYKPVKLDHNLWLLYGPSVSSILYSERNQGGVASDIQQPMTERLEAEFLRLLDLNL